MSKLTPKFVKEVVEPGSYQDGRGLILRVAATGRKNWIFRYSFQGNRRDLSLGAYPALSLRDARLSADSHRVSISQGIDPLDVRRGKRATADAKSKAGRTFRSVAQRFIKTHSEAWSEAYAADWKSSMTNHVYERLGKIAPADIDTDLVLEVLQPIWLKIPVTAKRIRNRIELVLDAAKAKGLRSGENPARWRGHLDKLLPRQPRNKQAFLAYPWEKAPQLLESISSLGGMPARAMELLILSACRSAEVRKAQWEEFNLVERIWTIPAERMKAGVTHRVPLNQRMVEVLESVKGIHPRWVFPNARKTGPIPANSLGRILKELKVDSAVPHGFRSTFRTWAAEATDFSRDVCEMALAHTLPDKVEAAYNRAELLSKRRMLMDSWAAHLSTGERSLLLDDVNEAA